MTRRAELVAIGAGSNLGDRRAHLRFARGRLDALLEDTRWSRVYETAPMYVEEQPTFLNACCTGRSGADPYELLDSLKEIEREAGRQRSGKRFGPRTLDLDLLLYGGRRIAGERLEVPHPRLSERPFVLVPLREIAAEWVVPGLGRSVDELAAALDVQGRARGTGSPGPELPRPVEGVW